MNIHQRIFIIFSGIKICNNKYVSSNKNCILYNYTIINNVLCEDIYEWEVLITKKDEEIYFGICNEKEIVGDNINDLSNIFVCSDGKILSKKNIIERKEIEINENDIIKLMFIKNTNSLYIKINEDEYKNVFFNLENKNYYPIILFNGNSDIHLISFIKKYNSNLLITKPNLDVNNIFYDSFKVYFI